MSKHDSVSAPGAAFVAVAVGVLVTSVARAAVIVVPDDQPNIQAGIDAASDGDTVLIAPGFYAESLLIEGKSVALQGMGTAEATVIDGGAVDRVLAIVDVPKGVALSNLTIQNGGQVCSGAGVHASNSSLVISGCVIRENHARCPEGVAGSGIGGGILSDSDVTVTDSVIENNSAEGRCVRNCFDFGVFGGGGGISGSTVTLIGCKVRGNSAIGDGGCGSSGWGGGVAAGFLYAAECVFTSNHTGAGACAGTTVASGGAISAGSVVLERSILRSNVASAGVGMGGGLRAAAVEIVNCEFVGNRVGIFSVQGSAMDIVGGGTIQNSTIVANCGGDAIRVGSGGQGLLMTNSIVWGGPSGDGGMTGDIQASHCLIEGGWEGEGNIDADPKFEIQPFFSICSSGEPPFANGFLRLNPASPCIDSGSNDLAAGSGQRDLDGRPRFLYGACFERPAVEPPVVDIGCYEYRNFEAPLGDLNGDCQVTGGDVATLLSEWGTDDGAADLDGDGLVDGADLGVLLAMWGQGPGDAVYGVCCVPTGGGSCFAFDVQGGCEMGSGVYLAPGSECFECFSVANFGACCLPDMYAGGTAECLYYHEIGCTFYGGEFMGIGVPCTSGCPGVGACCMQNGQCYMYSESICQAVQGQFMGLGVSCVDGCAGYGACCFGQGVCWEVSKEDCEFFSGVYQGDGVSCFSGDPCP